MKREIVLTSDGSPTVAIPAMNVTYHSKHGAVQESMHVFIEAGLQPIFRLFTNVPITVFEMGLGTGLNALLTLLEGEKEKRKVHYTALEKYPLNSAEISQLSYETILPASASLLAAIHGQEWNTKNKIGDWFTLAKYKNDLLSFSAPEAFHLIYFDAFAPTAQPELWTEDVFKKLFEMLLPNGILVTYCSKGVVRRAMQAAGFFVEKIPGPPGKREMVRAYRC